MCAARASDGGSCVPVTLSAPPSAVAQMRGRSERFGNVNRPRGERLADGEVEHRVNREIGDGEREAVLTEREQRQRQADVAGIGESRGRQVGRLGLLPRRDDQRIPCRERRERASERSDAHRRQGRSLRPEALNESTIRQGVPT